MDGDLHPDAAPSFFICPISLQIMKDPVTISTGITFDRQSIQKWLFSYHNTTCPVTKQPLSDFLLTPNSNLLRLIQSWNLQNPPSTRPLEQNSSAPLQVLLEEIKLRSRLEAKSLAKIKSLIQENGDNRKICFEDDRLYSLISSLVTEIDHQVSHTGETSLIVNEAVSILCLLKPSDEMLKIVSQNANGLLIGWLCSTLISNSSNQTRIQAAFLLKSIFKVTDEIYKSGLKPEFFNIITEIFKDQNSKQEVTKTVLTILISVLPYGKNKEKAIKGGLVPVVVELLAETSERHECEMMLIVLAKLCKKAEGRADFVGHPLGMAAVLAKLLRVSHVGNYKVMSLLLWVFRCCKSSNVAQQFIEVGGVVKVCMVIQSGCSLDTKDKAREILGFHLKHWKNSPCFPSGFKG